MSVDVLQEKIRKRKNPSILELGMALSDIPSHIREEAGSSAVAYGRYCRELLVGLKNIMPAVRVSFASFALLGAEGMTELVQTLKCAGEEGYYVLLDAPEMLSPSAACQTAEALLGEKSGFPCDGLVISGYMGSDVIKPFLPYCKNGKKDIFVIARTANKSAPELQDLLAGSRLVHAAAADHVNRYGADTAGKFGYTRVGLLAAASAADSLRTLRTKYPRLFFLLDGYDYPNANAKNCSYAFDKYGHGAAACGGSEITGAWKTVESDGRDFLDHALAAAERMKKNLTRYVTVL
jgi:orotidine-5'-phosphate decarboxylase